MKNRNNTNNTGSSNIQKLINAVILFCHKLVPKKATTITGKKLQPLSFDSLRLLGSRKKDMEEINRDASHLVKEHLNNVRGLLEFIERRGTKVIAHKNADKVIKLFGEIEGFIPPVKGIRAKLLTLALKIIGAWDDPLTDETPPLFVFGEKEPPMGYMVHQIHHWLSFNKGLPGYTEETMNNFKKIFDPSFGVEDVMRMSKQEIIELREAIARDQEALDFVQKMAAEIFKPQDVLKGIKEGDKKNI
ncbi:MAG: hypothetical protein AB7V50_03880 [Vampirovibrionia bacterium]